MRILTAQLLHKTMLVLLVVIFLLALWATLGSIFHLCDCINTTLDAVL